MTKPAAQTELLRLGALSNYKILYTPPEEPFDRIVRIARRALRVPIAQIAFIDHERLWSKAGEGLAPCRVLRCETFCAYTIESDLPLVVPDAQADARFCELPVVQEAPFVRSYAGVPLRTPVGLRIGTICAMDVTVRHMSADEISMLQDLALLVMDELELRLVATNDSLTGAVSRLSFLGAAARQIDRARRKPHDLSCILLDIDHFKAINDSYGHAAGDRVLQELVALLRAELRRDLPGNDHIGRLGGGEFAILLPGVSRVDARAIGERVRQRMMDAAFAVPDGEVNLTVSLGVATLNPSDGGIEDLLRRADDALYAAKTAGRNRVVSDGRPHLRLVQ